MTPPRRLIDLGLRLAVLTAAFLIPLVFYLDAYEVFELSKSMALKVFGMGAAVLLLLRGDPIRARSIIPSLAFLGMCLLSMTRTPLAEASLERVWEFSCIIFLLWSAETAGIPHGAMLSTALFSWALVTGYGLLQYLGVDWIQWTTFGEKRPYATMGNPDFLAAQSSFLIPVMTTMLFSAWKRSSFAVPLLVACLLLSLPSMLYTQARGAYLGFLAAIIAVGWMALRFVYQRPLRDFLKWIAVGAAVLAILLSVTAPGRRMINRFSELRDPVKSASVQIRLFYWYSGFLMGRSAPLTGSGIGAFHLSGAAAQGQAQDIWNRVWPRAAEVVSPHLELYAHNDYVHLFAETGPVGLGIYLWIMASLLLLGLDAVKRIPPQRGNDRWLAIGLLAAVFSFYVNSLMNFPLKVVPNLHLIFAVCVPILLSMSAASPMTMPLPRQRAAVFIALLAALALSERVAGKLVATSYLKIGHRTLLAGRVQESLPMFDKTRRLRPVHTDAILANYYSGKARQGQEDYRGAVDDFTKSIASFPSFPEGHQARGLAMMAVASKINPQDPSGAAKLMVEAVAELRLSAWLNPKDAATLFYLGSALRIQRKSLESVTPFEECIRYDPEMRIPDARFALAQSLIDLKRPQEARRRLEELIARQPGFPGAKALLAKTLR